MAWQPKNVTIFILVLVLQFALGIIIKIILKSTMQAGSCVGMLLFSPLQYDRDM